MINPLPKTDNAPHILLVEDHAGNAKFMTFMLDTLDCHFKEVRKGADAIEECSANAYDLILMDLNLPDMDGFDITKACHQTDLNKNTPIVGLSAVVTPKIRKECIAAGMKNLYSKQTIAETMNEIIARYAKDYCG